MTQLARYLCALAAWLALSSPPALGQDAEPGSDSPAPQEIQETEEPATPRPSGDETTREAVQAKLDAIGADAQLDEESRKRLTDLYRNALGKLERAAEWRRQVSQVLAYREAAPAAVLSARAELEQPLPAGPVVAADAPLSELEESLAEARRALDGATRRDSDLREQLERRSEQKVELPARYQELQQELRALEAQLRRDVETEGADQDEALAERVRQRAQRTLLRAESEAVTAELDTLNERIELLDVQIEIAARLKSAAEQLVEARADVVATRRGLEAQRASEAAESAADRVQQASPRLRVIAEKNAALANDRSQVLAKTQSLAEQYETAATQLDRIIKAHERAQDRDNLESGRGVRLSRGTAALLRQQWSELPDPNSSRQRADLWRRQLSASQLAQVEAEARFNRLADLDQLVAAELAQLQIAPGDPDAPGGGNRARLEEEARELLRDRARLMELLAGSYRPLCAQLRDLKNTDEKLEHEIRTFSTFIEKRLLWTVSSPPIWATDFSSAGTALAWLVSPDNWRDAFDTVAKDAAAGWKPYSLVGFIVAGLLIGRRWLKRRLVAYGDEARRETCARMTPTWRAVLVTALLIAPAPLLLRWIGWQLKTELEVSEFALALGKTMYALALLMLLVEIPRQVLRKSGLAEEHFEWGSSAPKRARSLGWLLSLLTLTVAPAAMIRSQTVSEWQPSVQRLMLILALLALALCSHFALRRISDPETSEDSRRSWAWRTSHATGVFVPLALAVLATLGYFVTALQLSNPFIESIAVIFIAVAAHALVHRWLLVTRRAATLERRIREKQEAEDPESEEDGHPAVRIDLDKADFQTRRMFDRLLLIGSTVWLWALWSDLVELGGVQEIELWRTGTLEDLYITTLNDLLVALLGLAVTFIGARNLPGVLDLLLLRKLPIRPGDRLVIGTVSRYLIILIGLGMCMRRVGLGWGQLQWMAAAVSVGLGFGLQEIFANFISGVIILFERPIRIGDLVTVGQIDGRVTNIALRATTITDYDRRELLVPNKEFITRQLVNWTLSDTVTRVVFPVSVSRSCDPGQASDVLTRIARRSPLVMKEPKPDVVFRGFSEDALNFDLRVFIAERSSWTDLMNSLNLAIHTEFAKAGLEIATRHQDLHVKSIEGLPQIFADRADVTVEELGPE